MPPIWVLIIVFFYFTTLAFVFCFSIAQLHLTYNYLFSKKLPLFNSLSPKNENLPKITLQLPIFNELYVIDRLFDSVMKLDYPKNKLEIQVLDDSTDETFGLVEIWVLKLKNLGFEAIHLHRKERQGFKAGALADGLKQANGAFIAIFDADFIINPNFLLDTLPYFENENIGMVQTKWLHINENYSLLTQMQAFGLDAHFTIDQVGRNQSGHFSNFNGTGGVWRKACIEAAGGWSADSLTEDLDLSYRAQLKGWKFRYLEHIGNFAELPAEILGIKSQQFRWAKGAAECAKKLLMNILTQKNISIANKIHSFFHLSNSLTYLGLFITSILTIPVIILQNSYPIISQYVSFAKYFQISFLFLGIYFWVSYREKQHSFWKFIWLYPSFLAFMMGLALYNSLGVLEGYFGKKSPFIRTPKYNINTQNDSWFQKKYVSTNFSILNISEGVFCIYFLIALIYIIQAQAFGSIPFVAMLFLGYCCVFGYGIYHRFLK
jgi:cellulose synthase/poly-beta-1,6-N-acetylglucosamine synthase-like glycosyltransferase